ncbi:MAG: DUF2085 domain-containing protein [Brevefilum sp.]|nr:DUF2085 domain-containing protein [Brevefilum sp.]
MIQVTLFISEQDSRLEQIKTRLNNVQESHPHHLDVINLDRDQVLKDEFAEKAPVLDIGVYRLIKTFEEDEIHFAFEKAEARLREAQSKGNEVLVERITQPMQMTKADRFSRWFSNHYMVLLNGFVFLYVFLAIFAPTLMKIGWEGPAKVIYRVYSPLCHQLAYRSFFLFGEQPYYPRQLADMPGVITYGEMTGFDENDVNTARAFLGNQTMGFKIALCQRDIAIYGMMLIFGLFYAVSTKKMKPLPWYLWILIGLGPIGLDGFSQLLSQTGWGIFAWIPLRESTPFFRVITGALFGLTTAWFGYPYLEESVVENRREMALKHAITRQIHEGQEQS